ncbi:PREDICTED: protein FLC EXPRESSOR isoform X2 [Tarenaya hassleriana]|uniref:protein FLC EXPRESSOR isoform X1 n=1 Tax=Tarenaya hassleriana TaxID=28532 RepID=UPI00053C24C7|nr:PREDICTED: protein FLC EXPRESSOR isoform X1 [Tarenaya hassleriana]XP_010521974.1 PREDICTED: protein FLC EXPRESSOR isoform X3 [Tarenaya hassleriana]XP_019056588.1 PREDICTED: protein FLC EXPRESSOR isoform X2 [Tarenaya hassleriana]
MRRSHGDGEMADRDRDRDRYRPPTSVALSSHRSGDQSLIGSDPTRIRSSVLLEDRIEIQQREIQSLLADNQRIAVAHVALKEELAAAKLELERLLQTAAKVKAERDAKVREVYQSSLKIEAEARVVGVLGVELDQVRADVQKLAAGRDELAAELATIDGELTKVKSDSERAAEIKGDIETLREEIRKGREAMELEKKTRASNLHHKRVMEKTFGLLNSEIIKLREELASLRNKAKGAAIEAPSPNQGFAASSGNQDVIYGGHRPYSES